MNPKTIPPRQKRIIKKKQIESIKQNTKNID